MDSMAQLCFLWGSYYFCRCMIHPVHKLFLLLRCKLLLAMYVAFFAVQFCCFTGPDNVTVSTAAASSMYQPQRGKQKTVTGKDTQRKKKAVRLNKRFQPAIAPAVANMAVVIPVKYISTDPVKVVEYPLFSYILASSLRGPPVVS